MVERKPPELNANEPSTTELNKIASPAEAEVPASAGETVATETGAPVEPAQDLLARLEADLAEARDKHLRLLAEYDNFRKRTRAEVQQILVGAGERIIRLLLPVMDDFERLLNNDPNPTDADSLKQGAELIYRKLEALLTAEGLKPIEAVGKPFDPELHEAVAASHDPEQPAGVILSEVERGYLLNGRILRHARVVVNQFPPTEQL